MIEIKNGCKTYKSKTGESVKALDNVNIAFPETGIIFITGKSGSGKSTLLNVLGGIDKLDFGELIINGRNINELSVDEKNTFYNEYVGFIYQDYNLLEYMSVKYNILLPYYISNKKWDENRLEEILERLCIKELKDRPVNELSGGQKQRVAIARSILQNTKIILADEPTGALDHDNSEELYKTLKELSKDILIIVVSHDLEGAEKYSDYTIKMQDGVLDNSSNVEIENNNNLNLKPKKNMYFKEAFKLGMKMLYRKKIRLILSLILMVLSIGMLTIAVSLSEFNSYKILTKAMDDYNENNIFIGKKIELMRYNVNFTENDIDKINNINSTGYKVYNVEFDSTDFDLAVEYSDKFKNDFNLKLLSGKLPEENQCLVSSMFYYISTYDGYNGNEINSFDDLIGKEISSSNAKFVISGIFDDGYTKANIYDYLGYSDGSLDKRLKDKISSDIFTKLIIFNADIEHNSVLTPLSISYGNYTFINIESDKLVNLQNKEYIRVNEGNYFINVKYAFRVFEEYDYFNRREALSYAGYSEEEIDNIISNELIEAMKDSNKRLIVSMDSVNNPAGCKTIEIAVSGFFFDDDIEIGYIQSCDELKYYDTTDVRYLLFSRKNDIGDIIKEGLINAKCFYDNTFKAIKNYDAAGCIGIDSNYLLEAAFVMESEFDTFEYIFAGIALVFLVISFVMMLKYINENIDLGINEIGILKSLGASSRDIIRVFNTQNIFSIAICLLGVSIIYPIGIFIINQFIAMRNDYPLDIFFVGIKGILALIIVGVILPIISTIFPIIRISKKKILDLLRNKKQ